MRPSVHALTIMALAIVGACATIPVTGDPAVAVYATGQTEPVGTVNRDAADDPAIWRNPDNPAASLIVATDKVGGLYVYDLSGKQRSFLPVPRLNNVDLEVLEDGTVMVAASDRADEAHAHILLAELDTEQGTLTSFARIPVGPGEGYGICMSAQRPDGSITVYSAPKNGAVYATTVAVNGDAVSHQTTKLGQVPSQPEGCVFDPRSQTLYIGEEIGGIWTIDAATGQKRLVAPVDDKHLVADLEGLALVPEGSDAGWIYASSQGDNTFMRYSLPEMTPSGRFRIAQGDLGSVEETDGIEVVKGDFGPDFPGGLFVAQDGINDGQGQNFKLVPLAAIEAALRD